MIITKLVGGLGNQLFQYALGRHLSHIHQVPLKLDNAWYRKKIRSYELGYFCIKEDLASPEEVATLTRMDVSLASRLDRNIRQPLLPYYRRHHVKEQAAGFDPMIFQSNKNAYLSGYWQSERYFKAIEDTVRHDLRFIEPMDEKNRILARQITEINAVSLHIRRGDYVSNPEYQKTFGICGADYYGRAIDCLASRIQSPHFFIFSDDIPWVVENVKVSFPYTVVNHNRGTDSYRDMQLMSLCKHNIIANSTFSWWGAWLNPNPDKIVVTPKNWFSNQSLQTKDLIPEGWTII